MTAAVRVWNKIKVHDTKAPPQILSHLLRASQTPLWGDDIVIELSCYIVQISAQISRISGTVCVAHLCGKHTTEIIFAADVDMAPK